MKKTFLNTLFFAAALFTGCQRESIQPDAMLIHAPSVYKPNFVLAKTNSELKSIHLNPNANLLRTPKDFNDFLTSGNTPLSKLSKRSLDAFKSRLVFREGVGVVGLNYACIESELSYDDFAQVLALFGLDAKKGYWGFSKDPQIKRQLAEGGSALPNPDNSDHQRLDDGTDYEGYACIAKHNCSKENKCICMSGCDNP